MSTVSSETYSFTKISLSNKVTALDTTLKECLFNFKGLMLEVEQISNECESYKADFAMQKEKCENKSCSSSEVLKKVIESKETIIQLAAAAVTKLNETKNFNVVSEIFKILCGEVVTLTPPRDSQEQNRHEKIPLTDHPKTTANVKKKLLITPKKELNSQDVSIKDESICEIDGTPGRTSPIIHSKKLKSSSSVSSLSGSSDSRDKKKCPDSWSTPEPKQLKLSYTMTGKSGGKQRQMRLNFVNTKSASVVDLTSSPEFSGGVRSQNPHVQLIIKQESSENDDTILPSPTSGDGKFALSKTISKDSQKFKKPLSLSKLKHEEYPDEANSPIIQVVEKKPKDISKLDELEDSINILKPNRFPRSPYKASPKKVPKYQSPLKKEPLTVIIKTETSLKPEKCLPKEQRPSNVENNDDDITHCEEASMSILRHVDSILDHAKEGLKSPTKRPLVENKNCVNTQSDHESSMSLLRQEPTEKPIEDNAKRKATENVEPVYKEPTVRKKAEKLALPGWCCDECKAFFGDLYADDADKIKAVIERCSKHRGRNNPARPKTPPGIWNPRWHVPTDTDDFNRLNDAL